MTTVPGASSEGERLREALDRLPAATCYRTHTQPDEGKGVFGAVWKADVLRVAPPSEPGLDAAWTQAELDVLNAASAMRHFAGRYLAGDSDVLAADVQAAIDDYERALAARLGEGQSRG